MTPILEPEAEGQQIASELVPATNIVGDDAQDTLLLNKMSEAAQRYIASFSWCDAVLGSYFGGGMGGILAVFFIHIRPSREDVDPWIWVITGDLPPAFIPIADCKSPASAYRSYMRGMTKWVELARKGEAATPNQGVPPVKLPATPEWAENINQKLYAMTLTVKYCFEGDGNKESTTLQ